MASEGSRVRSSDEAGHQTGPRFGIVLNPDGSDAQLQRFERIVLEGSACFSDQLSCGRDTKLLLGKPLLSLGYLLLNNSNRSARDRKNK